MTKAESKVIDFIKKHILLFLLVAVTIIAIFLRACGMDFQSDDFNSFLNSWWSIIKLNDFTGLATQVGNYNIPYQIIIYLMTLLPLNALYAYKIVSIIFAILYLQFQPQCLFIRLQRITDGSNRYSPTQPYFFRQR